MSEVPPQQPALDYDEQARLLVNEARVHRANLIEDHNAALVKYENALWRGGFESGYNQGWKDAYHYAFQEFERRLKDLSPPPLTERPDTTPPMLVDEDTPGPSAQDTVWKIVNAKPGLRGVEIVAATEEAGTPVKERTVRTALHRLKKEGLIVNRDERWYPPEAVPGGLQEQDLD